MSINNPSGGSTATIGENRSAHLASAPRAASSRCGWCSSTTASSTGRSARAWATVMPARTPAAAAAAQHRATSCRPALCAYKRTGGRFTGSRRSAGASARLRLLRRIRSVDQCGMYNDTALGTLPLHGPEDL